MIRKATRFDKTELIEMLIQFGNEFLPELMQYANVDYADKLLTNIIAGAGFIFIEQGKGMIIGSLAPYYYNDKVLALSENAWYVKPEFRNTTVGYRLFKAYLEEADKLKKENRIQIISVGKLHNSPDIHYQKYGFRKMQESYIK
jgi:predicted GNAT family N-acyltransferase